MLIFEDETLSAEHLTKLIRKCDPSIEILDVIESVSKGTDWLNAHPLPDLLLMDIQLSDGTCFELFKKIRIEIPVIFTTAFNEYAIRAFKVNSIDYLLKPVDYQELHQALEKFRKQVQKTRPVQIYEELYMRLLKDSQYKKRLLIRVGEQLKQVSTGDIAYCVSEEGMCWVVTRGKNRYPLDFSLDEMEKLLDPDIFFRINRQFLINSDSIGKIHTYFNNRLKLQLQPVPDADVIVSRERVNDFKRWLNN